MKKIIVSLIIIASQPCLFGQNKWVPYVSVEEGIHISDVRPSYNYVNLSVPAANAGMRLGGSYSLNKTISGEVTLGVIGIGTPGRFSNKLIVSEMVGHYNVLSKPYGPITKFNISAGVGSGLAESSNGRFGFSEHAVVGANIEMAGLLPFGTLIMGTRYTQFVDDYIDGNVVAGSNNDAVLRFYTAVRLDGTSKKMRQAIADAEALATKLQVDAKAAQEKSEELKKKLDATSKAHAEEISQLTDALEACNNSLATAPAENNEPLSTASLAKGYYVIIGSFPSQERAEEFASRLELEGINITFEQELATYRVVLSQHDNLAAAIRARDEARAITQNAWIAMY
ncbi:SPOR domain-containing protein [Schleiferiaceae bacterium]|nr:SPOR domain-containing protein [Schleiferiaceae bacterium]